jgi:hypothetical protein
MRQTSHLQSIPCHTLRSRSGVISATAAVIRVRGKVVPVLEQLNITSWRRIDPRLWVDLRDGKDDMEKLKWLTLQEIELRPLGGPARSQSLYRLRYWGSRPRILINLPTNVSDKNLAHSSYTLKTYDVVLTYTGLVADFCFQILKAAYMYALSCRFREM